jgi:hypothetical protein
VFDDLPPDPERLHTLRVWHAMWLARIDAKIEALQRRQAEVEQGRERRPRPPEWTVELDIGAGRPPMQVHAGDCYAAGKRRRPRRSPPPAGRRPASLHALSARHPAERHRLVLQQRFVS